MIIYDLPFEYGISDRDFRIVNRKSKNVNRKSYL